MAFALRPAVFSKGVLWFFTGLFFKELMTMNQIRLYCHILVAANSIKSVWSILSLIAFLISHKPRPPRQEGEMLYAK